MNALHSDALHPLISLYLNGVKLDSYCKILVPIFSGLVNAIILNAAVFFHSLQLNSPKSYNSSILLETKGGHQNYIAEFLGNGTEEDRMN